MDCLCLQNSFLGVTVVCQEMRNQYFDKLVETISLKYNESERCNNIIKLLKSKISFQSFVIPVVMNYHDIQYNMIYHIYKQRQQEKSSAVLVKSLEGF